MAASGAARSIHRRVPFPSPSLRAWIYHLGGGEEEGGGGGGGKDECAPKVPTDFFWCDVRGICLCSSLISPLSFSTLLSYLSNGIAAAHGRRKEEDTQHYM